MNKDLSIEINDDMVRAGGFTMICISFITKSMLVEKDLFFLVYCTPYLFFIIGIILTFKGLKVLNVQEIVKK